MFDYVLLLPPAILLGFASLRLIQSKQQRRAYTYDLILKSKTDYLILFDLNDALTNPQVAHETIDLTEGLERRYDAERASILLDFFNLLALGVKAGALDENLVREALERPMKSLIRNIEDPRNRDFAARLDASCVRREILASLLNRWQMPGTRLSRARHRLLRLFP